MDEPWADISRLVATGELALNWRATRILDLGFGCAHRSIIHFYAQAPFLRWVGVDLFSEEHYQYYLTFYRYDGLKDDLPGLPDLTEQEFNQIFSPRYGQTAESFLNTDDGTYDLLVLSNILHMNQVTDWKKLLIKSLDRLARNGYAYIKLTTTDSASWNEQAPFRESDIRTLKGIVEVLLEYSDPDDRRKTVFVCRAK